MILFSGFGLGFTTTTSSVFYIYSTTDLLRTTPDKGRVNRNFWDISVEKLNKASDAHVLNFFVSSMGFLTFIESLLSPLPKESGFDAYG